jgi:hypothetical protein
MLILATGSFFDDFKIPHLSLSNCAVRLALFFSMVIGPGVFSKASFSFRRWPRQALSDEERTVLKCSQWYVF